MAATNSAYLFNGAILPIHIPGVVKLDNLLALKLAEYGANIKALFHLDGLIVLKKGNDIGFIGYANEGSANLAHHATARHSKIRLSNGVKVIAFNDGGLNVMGEASFVAVVTTSIAGVSIKANFKASYYDNTTAYGARYRYRNAQNNGWTDWSIFNIQTNYGVIAAKNSAEQNTTPISGTRGITIQFQLYMSNPEGQYFTDGGEVLPTGIAVVLYQDGYNGNPVTYYIDTLSIETADDSGVTRLFANADFTAQLSGGNTRIFYINADFYYTFGYDSLTGQYIFLTYNEVGGGGSVPVPSTFEYQGYSYDSQLDADNQVLGGASQNTGIIYFNAGANTWHISYTGSNPNYTFGSYPANGYYAQGDQGGVYNQLYLIDGVQQ